MQKIDLKELYLTTLHQFEEYYDLLFEKTYADIFKSFENFLKSFLQVQPKQTISFNAQNGWLPGWPAFVVIDKNLNGHVCVEETVAKNYFKLLSKRFQTDKIRIPRYCSSVCPHPDFKPTEVKYIKDYSHYTHLYHGFSSHVASIQRTRVRRSSPRECSKLWLSRKHTFLALDADFWENVPVNIIEFGYAVCRAGYLTSRDDVHWPPIPVDNYRRAHYKVRGPRVEGGVKPFVFGDTKTIQKISVNIVLDSLISSLASPETSSEANDLVILGYGIHDKLKNLKLAIPSNVLVIDVGKLHQMMYATMGIFPLRSLLDALGLYYQNSSIGNTGNNAMHILEAYAKISEQLDLPSFSGNVVSPLPQTISLENISANRTNKSSTSSSELKAPATKRVTFNQPAKQFQSQAPAIPTPNVFPQMMGYYPGQPMMSPMIPPQMMHPHVVDFRNSTAFKPSGQMKNLDPYQHYDKRKSASYV